MAMRAFCRILLMSLVMQGLSSSPCADVAATTRSANSDPDEARSALSTRGNSRVGNLTNCVARQPNSSFAPWRNDTSDGLSVAALAAKRLEFQFGVGLQVYYLPVVLVLGLVGNTLSMFVMKLPHNRRISCGVYMGMLAVSDNALLFVVGYFHVIGYNLRSRNIWAGAMSDIECQLVAYLIMTFSANGVVLILAMTVDRFLAVRFPLKSAIWCSTKRAKLTIGITAAAMFLYNFPYLVYSKVIGNGKVCAAMIVQTPFSQAYSWFNLCVNSVVPFVVLLILNTFIIITIRSRSKKFPGQSIKETSAAQGSSGSAGKDNSRERNMTIMLVSVSFALLVLTIPMYIRMMVSSFVDTTSSVDTYAIYILMYHISNKLFYTNNCCNFYLYCIGGSKFREDLRSLFSLWIDKDMVSTHSSLSTSVSSISTTATMSNGNTQN